MTTNIFPKGLSIYDRALSYQIRPRNMKRRTVPPEFKMSCTPIQSHIIQRSLLHVFVACPQLHFRSSVAGIVSHVSASKPAPASDGDRTRVPPWKPISKLRSPVNFLRGYITYGYYSKVQIPGPSI
jgi:hypothetical protein